MVIAAGVHMQMTALYLHMLSLSRPSLLQSCVAVVVIVHSTGSHYLTTRSPSLMNSIRHSILDRISLPKLSTASSIACLVSLLLVAVLTSGNAHSCAGLRFLPCAKMVVSCLQMTIPVLSQSGNISYAISIFTKLSSMNRTMQIILSGMSLLFPI